MFGKAVLKVPGGKLLKVAVKHDGDTIQKVKLHGDFFVYPEDMVEALEERLVGVKITDVRGVVERGLSKAELYGVDVNSIVKVIWEAFG